MLFICYIFLREKNARQDPTLSYDLKNYFFSEIFFSEIVRKSGGFPYDFEKKKIFKKAFLKMRLELKFF